MFRTLLSDMKSIHEVCFCVTAINGYMYGNLPGLSVCEDTNVRWYLFGMGNEVDIHSAYFHGHVLTYQQFRVDTLSVFPASMVQASMLTKIPGKWLLSCQVNEHLEGMSCLHALETTIFLM